jgi:hypothetical protein
MKHGKSGLPIFILGTCLLLAGCAGDASSGSRNRSMEKGATADHTGAAGGAGGSSDARKSSGESDLDRRNRPGSETEMNSGSRRTTGGGTSLSDTERGNDPHRANR